MLFSGVILLSFAVLSTSFAQQEGKRVERSDGDFSRLRKRQEDQGYFDQCRVVDLWKGRVGYVNVFAFLDASWHYSYRQAIMLRLLKKRLEKAGFTDIWFFVVIAPPDLPADKMESDIEIEAWREIFSLESQNFLNLVETPLGEFGKDSEGDIVFIQDNSDLGIWEHFHASKDQVIIIDRCGRLTYQVIVPWSILYFPYVKAAILSTYKEDPCGSCDVQSTSMYTPLDYVDYLPEKGSTKEKESSAMESVADVQLQNSTVTTNESANTLINHDDKYETTTQIDMKDEDIATLTKTLNATTESEITHDDTTMNATFSETKNGEEKPNFSNVVNNSSSQDNITNNEKYEEMPTSTVSTSMPESVSNETSVIITNNFTTEDTKNISTNVDNRYEEIQGKPDVDSINTKDVKISPIDRNMEITNSDDKESGTREQENSMPMRIIMRAPHLHYEDGVLKKYMYLVLKTGNSDYHDHYDFEQDGTTSASSQVAKQQSTEIDQKLVEYIYNQDESPGLYGEASDYWRNDGDSDYIDQSQTSELNLYDSDNNVAMSNKNDNVDVTLNHENDLQKPNDLDANNSGLKTQTDVGVENQTEKTDDIVQLEDGDESKDEDLTSDYSREEEIRHKLIEHYSKLVPWIHYVLNK